MKIVYIVPGPMPVDEQKRREGLLQEWAFPSTEVEIRCVDKGPASIESMYEEYLSIPETARLMYEAEQEGVDGAVLGCAGDPGLSAYRELTKEDRKSTRLNSSHVAISYAVFCLKKKKIQQYSHR